MGEHINDLSDSNRNQTYKAEKIRQDQLNHPVNQKNKGGKGAEARPEDAGSFGNHGQKKAQNPDVDKLKKKKSKPIRVKDQGAGSWNVQE